MTRMSTEERCSVCGASLTASDHECTVCHSSGDLRRQQRRQDICMAVIIFITFAAMAVMLHENYVDSRCWFAGL